ncbi:MAG: glycosyltransferase family 9 protein [Candidatus Stahlbacteria bacterium]|nr:glycosyltransferase family 9 protein [Candidatus Stahlbacteria bacterium]
MFIPTIKSFRNYFPSALFFLVTYKNHLPIFKELLLQFNLIDEFIAFDGRYASIAERIEYIKRIRNEQFDMSIKNFLIGINFIIGLPKIPYRIGHISSPDFPMRGNWMLNYPVELLKDEHEISRNIKLFYAISNKTNRIGMQIGVSGANDWKEWDVLKFGELANKLISQYGVKVVLLGDEKAIEKGKMIENISNGQVLNLINKTSIIETAEIIKRCKLFISNDSGLMWVAQAVGTPVVAIYGPTDYRRTGPIGLQDKIISKSLPCSPCYKSPIDYVKVARCKNRECLASITTQEVMNGITSLTNRH